MQFKIVKSRTNTSHVMQYGNKVRGWGKLETVTCSFIKSVRVDVIRYSGTIPDTIPMLISMKDKSFYHFETSA